MCRRYITMLAAARTPPHWSSRNWGLAAVRMMMMILVPTV